MVSCFLFPLISPMLSAQTTRHILWPSSFEETRKDFEPPGPWHLNSSPFISSPVRGRQHELHLLINSADQVTCLEKVLKAEVILHALTGCLVSEPRGVWEFLQTPGENCWSPRTAQVLAAFMATGHPSCGCMVAAVACLISSVSPLFIHPYASLSQTNCDIICISL